MHWIKNAQKLWKMIRPISNVPFFCCFHYTSSMAPKGEWSVSQKLVLSSYFGLRSKLGRGLTKKIKEKGGGGGDRGKLHTTTTAILSEISRVSNHL